MGSFVFGAAERPVGGADEHLTALAYSSRAALLAAASRSQLALWCGRESGALLGRCARPRAAERPAAEGGFSEEHLAWVPSGASLALQQPSCVSVFAVGRRRARAGGGRGLEAGAGLVERALLPEADGGGAGGARSAAGGGGGEPMLRVLHVLQLGPSPLGWLLGDEGGLLVSGSGGAPLLTAVGWAGRRRAALAVRDAAGGGGAFELAAAAGAEDERAPREGEPSAGAARGPPRSERPPEADEGAARAAGAEPLPPAAEPGARHDRAEVADEGARARSDSAPARPQSQQQQQAQPQPQRRAVAQLALGGGSAFRARALPFRVVRAQSAAAGEGVSAPQPQPPRAPAAAAPSAAQLPARDGACAARACALCPRLGLVALALARPAAPPYGAPTTTGALPPGGVGVGLACVGPGGPSPCAGLLRLGSGAARPLRLCVLRSPPGCAARPARAGCGHGEESLGGVAVGLCSGRALLAVAFAAEGAAPPVRVYALSARLLSARLATPHQPQRRGGGVGDPPEYTAAAALVAVVDIGALGPSPALSLGTDAARAGEAAARGEWWLSWSDDGALLAAQPAAAERGYGEASALLLALPLGGGALLAALPVDAAPAAGAPSAAGAVPLCWAEGGARLCGCRGGRLAEWALWRPIGSATLSASWPTKGWRRADGPPPCDGWAGALAPARALAAGRCVALLGGAGGGAGALLPRWACAYAPPEYLAPRQLARADAPRAAGGGASDPVSLGAPANCELRLAALSPCGRWLAVAGCRGVAVAPAAGRPPVWRLLRRAADEARLAVAALGWLGGAALLCVCAAEAGPEGGGGVGGALRLVVLDRDALSLGEAALDAPLPLPAGCARGLGCLWGSHVHALAAAEEEEGEEAGSASRSQGAGSELGARVQRSVCAHALGASAGGTSAAGRSGARASAGRCGAGAGPGGERCERFLVALGVGEALLLLLLTLRGTRDAPGGPPDAASSASGEGAAPGARAAQPPLRCAAALLAAVPLARAPATPQPAASSAAPADAEGAELEAAAGQAEVGGAMPVQLAVAALRDSERTQPTAARRAARSPADAATQCSGAGPTSQTSGRPSLRHALLRPRGGAAAGCAQPQARRGEGGGRLVACAPLGGGVGGAGGRAFSALLLSGQDAEAEAEADSGVEADSSEDEDEAEAAADRAEGGAPCARAAPHRSLCCGLLVLWSDGALSAASARLTVPTRATDAHGASPPHPPHPPARAVSAWCGVGGASCGVGGWSVLPMRAAALLSVRAAPADSRCADDSTRPGAGLCMHVHSVAAQAPPTAARPAGAGGVGGAARAGLPEPRTDGWRRVGGGTVQWHAVTLPPPARASLAGGCEEGAPACWLGSGGARARLLRPSVEARHGADRLTLPLALGAQCAPAGARPEARGAGAGWPALIVARHASARGCLGGAPVLCSSSLLHAALRAHLDGALEAALRGGAGCASHAAAEAWAQAVVAAAGRTTAWARARQLAADALAAGAPPAEAPPAWPETRPGARGAEEGEGEHALVSLLTEAIDEHAQPQPGAPQAWAGAQLGGALGALALPATLALLRGATADAGRAAGQPPAAADAARTAAAEAVGAAGHFARLVIRAARCSRPEAWRGLFAAAQQPPRQLADACLAAGLLADAANCLLLEEALGGAPSALALAARLLGALGAGGARRAGAAELRDSVERYVALRMAGAQ